MVMVVIMGDGLDIHAAFGRGDDRDAPGDTVDQHRQVEFLCNVDAVGDVEAVDPLAGFASLHCHQRVAEHFLGVGFDFLD
jgi:hypothetical protein